MTVNTKKYSSRAVRFLRSAAILPLLLFYGGEAVAQADDYFDLPPEQLLGAEITSVSKRSEKLANAPAAAFIITNEDIERTGVQTIADALRLAPGVHVAQSDSNTSAISIRGFNGSLANKLLVLIDGRIVYNPLFGGTFWEIQDVMLEDVDRIEVVRGPGGTLWGANAVNGVINIITRKAQKTQGALVSAIYGNEQASLNTRYGGALNDGYYRLYARGFNREESRRADGSDNHDGWDGYRAGFRYDDDVATFQGDVYTTDTDQRRTQFLRTAPFSVLRDQEIEFKGGNVLARWTDDFANGSQIRIQTYFDYAERVEPYNFTDRRLIYDLDMQYNFAQLDRHAVIVGGGYRLLVENQKNSTTTIFTPAERKNQLFNFFAQDKITLSPDDLFLTVGAKFEHNDFSGFEVQPSARLQWHPDDQQTVWTAVSHAVRTPTPLETDIFSVLGSSAATQFALIPNDNFDSEELTAYEIGYRNQISPSVSLDAAAFYNDYDQLATIGLLPGQIINDGVNPAYTQIPVLFENDMTGKAYGVELSAGWAVTPRVKLTANYSLMRLRVDAADNSVVAQEGAEDAYPPHQFSLRTSWDINSDWTLDSTAYYVDEIRANDVGDYIRLDMNLGYRLNDNLRFNITGQNLLDDAHRELDSPNGINSGEVERSVFGKVTWQF